MIEDLNVLFLVICIVFGLLTLFGIVVVVKLFEAVSSLRKTEDHVRRIRVMEEARARQRASEKRPVAS